jgi:hypothetical protein
MRKLLIASLAVAGLTLLAPSASAAGPRADSYWVVHCADGNTYEAVDSHAVSPGGKDHAVELFSQNTGLECWLEPATT